MQIECLGLEKLLLSYRQPVNACPLQSIREFVIIGNFIGHATCCTQARGDLQG
jgi:hypothetical protein